MKQPSEQDGAIFRFGAFRLLTVRRELWHRDEAVPLGGRAFDLLIALVTRAGAVASKEELIATVWGGSVVEENNLAVQIAALRRVLAMDPSMADRLQTIPRRGYRFAGPVDVEEADGAEPGRLPEALLSITVQAFACVGEDQSDCDMAQALRDGVLAGLSRLYGVRVYAGETSRDAACSSDYQVRATLQRSGAALRVSAQLFDSSDGAHVWSETFDGFDVRSGRMKFQDEVSCRITSSVGRYAFVAAARRAPRRLGGKRANQSLIHAIAADARPQSLECLLEQEVLLRQTIERAPENGDAHARLARAILLQAVQEHAGGERKGEAVRRGAAFVERALMLDPQNARAHLAASYLHMLEGDFTRCARSAERALMIDRGFAMAHNMLATALAHLGQGEAAILIAETAVRLDPAGPQSDVYETTLGLSRLLAGDVDGSIDCFTRARAANPRLPRAHGWAAITLGIKGEVALARRAVADLLRVAPEYRLTRSVDGCTHLSTMQYRRLFEAVVARGAVAAGVPL